MHRPKSDDGSLLRRGRSRRGFRSRSHVVHMVHVMMMVVMMMVVMMGPHRRLVVDRRRSGGGAGGCFLGDGISGEAKRENRRGGKGLDHERKILWLGKPKWVGLSNRDLRLNSI